jgi:hypothetical protein
MDCMSHKAGAAFRISISSIMSSFDHNITRKIKKIQIKQNNMNVCIDQCQFEVIVDNIVHTERCFLFRMDYTNTSNKQQISLIS